MFERGLPEETKPFCDLALSIGEQLKSLAGEEALNSIRESHCFLGIALVETNEHALSLVHKRKWLDSLEDRTTEGQRVQDYELGYAYNEIGVAYGNENLLDEAAEAFLRSVEIFQGLDDYEDTMLGWPEPNLGFIYWMQNRLDEAEKALVEILDIHAAAWGPDDTKSFK
jgi:tetratricopeptide (TPR) repeat protein